MSEGLQISSTASDAVDPGAVVAQSSDMIRELQRGAGARDNAATNGAVGAAISRFAGILGGPIAEVVANVVIGAMGVKDGMGPKSHFAGQQKQKKPVSIDLNGPAPVVKAKAERAATARPTSKAKALQSALQKEFKRRAVALQKMKDPYGSQDQASTSRFARNLKQGGDLAKKVATSAQGTGSSIARAAAKAKFVPKKAPALV